MSYLGPIIIAGQQQRQREEEERKQRDEEEEQLTPYAAAELAQSWEFKIVRCSTNLFANPQIFRRLIEEEAEHGWVMVEKFDDERVRFKRQRGARAAANHVTTNPYRTQFSVPMTGRDWALALAIPLACGAVFLGVLWVLHAVGAL